MKRLGTWQPRYAWETIRLFSTLLLLRVRVFLAWLRLVAWLRICLKIFLIAVYHRQIALVTSIYCVKVDYLWQIRISYIWLELVRELFFGAQRLIYSLKSCLLQFFELRYQFLLSLQLWTNIFISHRFKLFFPVL